MFLGLCRLEVGDHLVKNQSWAFFCPRGCLGASGRH